MPKFLIPAERLIVAADFKSRPDMSSGGPAYVESQVISLAKDLQGTGVCLKVNSALRACGYGLIERIHNYGLRVFADLKLYDIPETLKTDGALLREFKPELLTTVCSAGVKALSALKEELPETEVLGVTVLTSLTNDDTQAMFTCLTMGAVLRFALVAASAKLDGLISSPMEVEMLRAKFGQSLSINTPGIRPVWAIVKGKDDQNPDRIMTPAKAILAGADRIVVGRPITQAKDRQEAVLRTIEEIASAVVV